MHGNILTVGLQSLFLDSLTNILKAENINVISSPSLDIAGWLLAHRRFLVALIDLEHFSNMTATFLYEVKKQPVHIIVVGRAGFQYSWPVEREADLFLSYETSIPQLAAYITRELSPSKNH
ncbi:MAG: hypothetical protein K2O45_09660 [Oscillospiraceae bacterium]|nr:hypothetical protein [Oscillospiraceae bacterium]